MWAGTQGQRPPACHAEPAPQRKRAQPTCVIEAAGQAARLVRTRRCLPLLLWVDAPGPPAPQIICLFRGAVGKELAGLELHAACLAPGGTTQH